MLEADLLEKECLISNNDDHVHDYDKTDDVGVVI